MFIGASVRNGFDTLKTILKFFFFKIYTGVRRLSGAESVQSQHYFVLLKSCWSSIQMWLCSVFPARRGCRHLRSSSRLCSTHRRCHAWKARGSRRAKPVVCANNQVCKTRRLKSSDRWRCLLRPPFNIQCGPRSLSDKPSFHFPLSSVWPSLTQFHLEQFQWNLYFTHFYKVILMWAKKPGRKTFGCNKWIN